MKLRLHQSAPEHIVAMLEGGEADIGIATEALAGAAGLAALPAYRWNHVVIARPTIRSRRAGPLTLADLARYPLVTYDPGYTGRSQIDEAFDRAGLTPDITLTALDADVIKTYVEQGLGVGIVASMAIDPQRDTGLVALDASHLFAANTTRIAVRRGAYLRSYTYRFIELSRRTWTRPRERCARRHPARRRGPAGRRAPKRRAHLQMRKASFAAERRAGNVTSRREGSRRCSPPSNSGRAPPGRALFFFRAPLPAQSVFAHAQTFVPSAKARG